MVSIDDKYFELENTKDRTEWLALYARRAVHNDKYCQDEQIQELFGLDKQIEQLNELVAKLDERRSSLRDTMLQRVRETIDLYPDEPSFVHFLYWTFGGIHAGNLPQGYTPITLTYCSKCNTCGEQASFSLELKSRHAIHELARHNRYEQVHCRCKREQEERHRQELERLKQEFKDGQATLERQEYLKTMPYAEYLQTPEWSAKRAAALKRAGYKCQLCGGNGELHVHHRTYENKGDERLQDLVVLCKVHHAQFHNKPTD